VFRRAMLILLLNFCVSLTASCTGGCWLKADAVSTEPVTDCLTLFAGDSPGDTTVCEVPELGGANNCSDALTLPKLSASGKAVVVAPGEKIAWWLPSQSVPPGITVTQAAGGVTNYVVNATLGPQRITMTLVVRNK
jgi:hypothetical protein